MQPPTWAAAFSKGVQVLPLGHCEVLVHMMIPPVQPVAALTHVVLFIPLA